VSGPPRPAGRRCGCGALLSRYNKSAVCSPCARAIPAPAPAPARAPAEVGQHIRKLRLARGWPLELLADFAGLSAGTVSKLENGKVASPGAATLGAVGAALGVTLPELLGAEGRELPSVGERLRELRRDRRLSQEQLAEKAGVGVGVIADLEQGRRDTALIATLAKLAGALGVTLPAMFGVVVDEAEVGRMVHRAYQAGRRDALAEAAGRLTGLLLGDVPGQAGGGH
jgi:transcriptional regulator with XRE-family HTH domain